MILVTLAIKSLKSSPEASLKSDLDAVITPESNASRKSFSFKLKHMKKKTSGRGGKMLSERLLQAGIISKQMLEELKAEWQEENKVRFSLSPSSYLLRHADPLMPGASYGLMRTGFTWFYAWVGFLDGGNFTHVQGSNLLIKFSPPSLAIKLLL